MWARKNNHSPEVGKSNATKDADVYLPPDQTKSHQIGPMKYFHHSELGGKSAKFSGPSTTSKTSHFENVRSAYKRTKKNVVLNELQSGKQVADKTHVDELLQIAL